jgi:proton glutamate symport protein
VTNRKKKDPVLERRRRPKWLSGTALIFYALVLGVLSGYLFPAESHPAAYETFRFLSRAFISLIKMLIVPLIFSTIVVGIGKTGDIKAVGRMGVKAIIYFELATTAALALGLSIAHIVRPGQGLTLPPSGEQLAKPKTVVETLLHLFPSNVIDAMAKQDILQVVVFATLVGIAAAHIGKKAETFLVFFDSVVAVMFQLTDYVMALTPLGVFGAMAGSVSHHGLAVLGSYAKLVASLYGALVLFTLLVLIPALLIVRANLRLFFRKIREPFLLAFSTASSEAALPRALEKMVEFGVPESLAGFVSPAGYSFHLVGSTL